MAGNHFSKIILMATVCLKTVILVCLTGYYQWKQPTHHYSMGTSIADVALASLLASATTLIFLHIKSKKRWLTIISMLFELVLFLKALAVAVLFPQNEQLWKAGLIYIVLIVAFLSSVIEVAAAKSSLARSANHNKKHKSAVALLGQEVPEQNGDSLTQPLIPSTTSANDDNHDAHHASSSFSYSTSSQSEDKDATSNTIMALIQFAAPDTSILFCAFAAGGIAALGQALIPYYTGKIIDYASIDPDHTKFISTTLKLLIVSFGCALFTGVRGGLFTWSMTRLNVRIRQGLFRSLLQQEAGFFDLTRTGELSSRLNADTTTVSDQISLNLNVMLRSALQAVMVMAFMFHASWRLSVVTFVLVPIVVAISKVYGAYYRQMTKKVQAELALANTVAEEALGSVTTVKAHAAEKSTEAAYAAKLAVFYNLMGREAVAYALYMTINTFLSAAVTAGILYYGGTLVLEKYMSAGSLVSFMLYQQSLTNAFQSLGDVFSNLSAAVGAADKVVELMQRIPEFENSGSFIPSENHKFQGKITLSNVCFSYPARPAQTVLSGLNLQVQPGEIVALCGKSGGGKSSIVKLVQRFYIPSSGRVMIDDRDVGTYDARWLKQRVALVSQEPVLYARSIKRNILYGLEEDDGVLIDQIPTQADVEAAARLANAHDFISNLPQGYDTECGERGVQLSGGQKQRIAIARALVRKPSVLLLDEATSALDTESEAAVQEALDRTMAGRTVLVIAHRLSTVQDADRIVVIGEGRVLESGSHDALIEDGGGVYAQLVRRQMTRKGSSVANLTTL
jgi:ATP-binding cassette, subfamily B (MDR/TAP), member 9